MNGLVVSKLFLVSPCSLISHLPWGNNVKFHTKLLYDIDLLNI